MNAISHLMRTLALCGLIGGAQAATLTQTGPDRFVYRPDALGTATLDWTDAAGRHVEHRAWAAVAPGDNTIQLDLSRAAVLGNTLTVTQPGTAAASLGFAAPLRPDPWSDWQTVIYQSRTQAQLAALRAIGVTGEMVLGNRHDPVQLDPAATLAPLQQQDMRAYVENIATDFYAEYHRYRPGKIESASLDAAKAAHRADPGSLAPYIREPSLSDPAWLDRIRARLTATVLAYAPYHPLYYDLADEAGSADLAAAWDFDFAPASLDGFRAWLQTQYPSLDALNRQWDRDFATWSAVMPDTTDQAMQRPGDNFSAWSDFKAWTDVAFARALQAGTQAVHAADPHAIAAIEGAQIPGWGGYDYARLAPSVDAMEIYDFGQNVDMARSFNPSLIMLSTLSGHGPAERHALWRSALMGGRGAVLWDEADDLARPDGTLGPGGAALQFDLAALHDGIGALFIASTRAPAGVAILASPASFRVGWMLDQRPAGAAWAQRDAEAEYADTAMRAATRGFAHLLGHLGVQPHFIAPEALAAGILDREKDRVLILPHTLALSDAEAAAVARFATAGGTIIADIVPGAFDGHGRRRPASPLASLFSSPAALFPLGNAAFADADDGRDPAALERLDILLRLAGVPPFARLLDDGGHRVRDVGLYVYRLGAATWIALQRDATTPQTQSVTVVTDQDGPGGAHHLTLGDRPALQSFLPQPRAAPVIDASATPAGQTAMVAIGLPPGTDTVLHIAVTRPDGTVAGSYSGNLRVHDTPAVWPVPLALNDPAGQWTITATDMLTQATAAGEMRVTSP